MSLPFFLSLGTNGTLFTLILIRQHNSAGRKIIQLMLYSSVSHYTPSEHVQNGLKMSKHCTTTGRPTQLCSMKGSEGRRRSDIKKYGSIVTLNPLNPEYRVTTTLVLSPAYCAKINVYMIGPWTHFCILFVFWGPRQHYTIWFTYIFKVNSYSEVKTKCFQS